MALDKMNTKIKKIYYDLITNTESFPNLVGRS